MNKDNNGAVTPMVSVVMIAYNMEKYISMAIKGVVTQKTDFPVELIVMDDNSTDSTPQIIERWQREYPAIIVNVRNPHNLGLQRNYLEGFARCRGKYMAICDADDYWFYKKKLLRQVRYMESHPECSISFHRMVNYYEASGEKSLSNGGQRADTTLADLCRSNYITNSSVLYRREQVDLKKLPDWIKSDRSPDYAMHVLYGRTGNIHYFRRPMGVYRKSAGSSWSLTREAERLRMSLAVRQRLMETIKDNEEAVRGMKISSANILLRMMALAEDEEERKLVVDMAKEMGIILPEEKASSEEKGGGKSLLTSVRRVVSRLIPLPEP